MPFTDDVAGCWGDLQAAKQLGINTYLSEPICIGDGELFSTLCGASASRLSINIEARRLLSMLAKLIARQLERDRLLERLQQENLVFSQQALTDPLTGIPNRRASLQELNRAIAGVRRSGTPLHLAFIDLDGFKVINDQYGHDAGDRFLIQIAQRLSEGLRDSDFVARYGGDEFLVFGPACSADLEESREAIRTRLESVTIGIYDLSGQDFFYAGPSIGVVTALADEKDSASLISRADAAMYEVKQARRSGR